MNIRFIEIVDQTEHVIKIWHNWTGVVPMKGDLVVIHFGDYNEEAAVYEVNIRCIDGTKPAYITCEVTRIESKP